MRATDERRQQVVGRRPRRPAVAWGTALVPLTTLAAGLVPVEGPAVTVSLNDAPRRAGRPPLSDNSNDVVVHQQDLQAVVTAIGDPTSLRESLNNDPGVLLFRSYVDRFGLGYDISTSRTVTLPAYDGPLELPSVRTPVRS